MLFEGLSTFHERMLKMGNEQLSRENLELAITQDISGLVSILGIIAIASTIILPQLGYMTPVEGIQCANLSMLVTFASFGIGFLSGLKHLDVQGLAKIRKIELPKSFSSKIISKLSAHRQ